MKSAITKYFLSPSIMVSRAKEGKYASLGYPCLADTTQPKEPQDGPWPPEGCHTAQCIGVGVSMMRVCPISGSDCGPGMYLKLNIDASAPADCCMCQPVDG